jgi:RNA polymerase sigma-70 factor (ECF subfamily)
MGWWNSFSQTTPEEKVIDNEERTFNQKLIGENIAKLPEIYRIPLILKDMEGMAMEKISEVLDLPLGTVKSRLNRGRAMLHDKLVNSMKVNNI